MGRFHLLKRPWQVRALFCMSSWWGLFVLCNLIKSFLTTNMWHITCIILTVFKFCCREFHYYLHFVHVIYAGGSIFFLRLKPLMKGAKTVWFANIFEVPLVIASKLDNESGYNVCPVLSLSFLPFLCCPVPLFTTLMSYIHLWIHQRTGTDMDDEGRALNTTETIEMQRAEISVLKIQSQKREDIM